MNIQNEIMALHDWELSGLEIDRIEKYIVLTLFKPEINKFKLIKLHGVKKLYVSDMAMQNVILDVMLFTDTNIDKKSHDYLNHSCRLMKTEPDLLNDSNQIFYIEPTIGAELACHFSRIEILD